MNIGKTVEIRRNVPLQIPKMVPMKEPAKVPVLVPAEKEIVKVPTW